MTGRRSRGRDCSTSPRWQRKPQTGTCTEKLPVPIILSRTFMQSSHMFFTMLREGFRRYITPTFHQSILFERLVQRIGVISVTAAGAGCGAQGQQAQRDRGTCTAPRCPSPNRAVVASVASLASLPSCQQGPGLAKQNPSLYAERLWILRPLPHQSTPTRENAASRLLRLRTPDQRHGFCPISPKGPRWTIPTDPTTVDGALLTCLK